MASISCTLSESSPITDWIAHAYKVSDGSLVGSADVTSSPFSVTVSTTEPCYVTLTPKMGARWTASALKAVGDYGYPTDLSATPKLYKISAVGDANYSYKVLGLHCDGSNGSNTFTDVKGHTITPIGNTQISTAQSKFGGASALFDGNGDVLSIADSDDWAFSTGNTTIAAWVYPTSLSSNQEILAQRNNADNNNFYYLRVNSTTGLISLVAKTSGTVVTNITSNNAVSTNTWTHVAAVRSGGTWKLYVGGVNSDTVTTNSTSAWPNVGYPLLIGAADDVSGYFSGYLDEVEIYKGIALYTSDFTPPSSAFTSSLTGSFEPTWPSSGTVVDGDVTWELVGDLVQPITHGPLIPS